MSVEDRKCAQGQNSSAVRSRYKRYISELTVESSERPRSSAISRKCIGLFPVLLQGGKFFLPSERYIRGFLMDDSGTHRVLCLVVACLSVCGYLNRAYMVS